MLLGGSVVTVVRGKSAWSLLQLIGAGGLLVAVITQLCEGLHLFPGMRWGEEHSVGHYLDVLGAALGLTLFPLGYFVQAASSKTHDNDRAKRAVESRK